MPRSILTEKIARRGYHIYREYGIDPLERHNVGEVMATAVVSIDAQLSPRAVRERYFGVGQMHRAFPVLEGDRLLGMLNRERLVEACANPGLTCMREIFGVEAPPMALPQESCRSLATRLAVLALDRLPVVSDLRSRRVLGIISRSDLIKPSLGVFDQEHHSEVLRRAPLAALRARFMGPPPAGADRG